MAHDLSAKASTLALVPDGVLKRRLRQRTARADNPSEGGETSTSKLVGPAVLATWSPPRVTGITENSMNPSAQDPEAQAGPDT
jgi:hypothetical protein